LGQGLTQISSDFFHYVYERVSKELGGETMVFQRALGGVAPIPKWNVSDLSEAETNMKRMSEIVWEPVSKAAQNLEWVDNPRLSFRSTPCTFPLTSPMMLQAYASGRLPIKAEEGFQLNEMALVEIGPAQFLTVPGEPHPEVVQKIADMMRGRFNFVLTMAQDEIGYVVPEELFDPQGGQELQSAGRDNEPVVLSAAARLLGVDGYLEPVGLTDKTR